MKKNLKKNFSSYDDANSFFSGKKTSALKNKGSKRRLSIYDEYEEEEDEFMVREKFKKRNR